LVGGKRKAHQKKRTNWLQGRENRGPPNCKIKTKVDTEKTKKEGFFQVQTNSSREGSHGKKKKLGTTAKKIESTDKDKGKVEKLIYFLEN